MKYSISNLAWDDTPLDQIIPKLANAGLQGVEIAPTAIWPDLDQVSDQEIIEFKGYLESHNLVVSGIQSLLYGHPELQLFDQSCWRGLRTHLEKVITVGGLLGADVAVFGSPKNRVRGILDLNQANHLASTFLKQLNPHLKANNIVLTLEPNAPDYGADYLTTYEDVVHLSNNINSEYIKPQIDTGCLWMIGVPPENAYSYFMPHHIHLSVPNLDQVPGGYRFEEIMSRAQLTKYSRWVVIEMLELEKDSLDGVFNAIKWLTDIGNEQIDV